MNEIIADKIILDIIKNHKKDISFDEKLFLDLLKNSLSLDLEEKKKILDKIPSLNLTQIEQLIEVFLEEKQKFEDIYKNNMDDIEKMKLDQKKVWLDLAQNYGG